MLKKLNIPFKGSLYECYALIFEADQIVFVTKKVIVPANDVVQAMNKSRNTIKQIIKDNSMIKQIYWNKFSQVSKKIGHNGMLTHSPIFTYRDEVL